MGLLSFGKKKKEKDISKALETIPSNDIPVPEPTNSSTLSLNKTPLPEAVPEEPIPIPKSLANISGTNPEVLPEEPAPVDIPKVSENSDEISFESLPDFSEDDFSAPQPPSQIAKPSVKETSIPREDVSKSSPVVDNTSIFGSTTTEEKHSAIGGGLSYAASEGVFVARREYLALLNTLRESSKSVKTLKTRQRHLIDFDLSMKKLFDDEATQFDKLHKDILAIMPFVSKK